MNISLKSMSVFSFTGFELSLQLFRYFALSGLAFFIFWKWGSAFFQKYKIQKGAIPLKQMKAEIKNSMVTIFFFSILAAVTFEIQHLTSWFHFYEDWSSRGTLYGIFSFFVLWFGHDTYFYWAHRFLHLPGIYQRFHLTHHYSHAPTPFTVYSFHWGETLVQGIYVMIMATFLPIHPAVLALFLLINTVFNLIGHLGYEFYGNWFVKLGIFKFYASSTHHHLHHAQSKSNFGFYFRIWDRLCKTESVDYEKNFLEKLQQRTEMSHQVKICGVSNPV